MIHENVSGVENVTNDERMAKEIQQIALTFRPCVQINLVIRISGPAVGHQESWGSCLMVARKGDKPSVFVPTMALGE